VNGDPAAIAWSGEFREVVRKCSFVVGRGTGSTTDYRLDAMTAHFSRAGRYITTWTVVAASGFHEVTDFGICRHSQSAWFLATSTSLWSMIPSLMVCALATETGSAALYASMDNSDGMIYVKQ
jgi:hypothetical protein